MVEISLLNFKVCSLVNARIKQQYLKKGMYWIIDDEFHQSFRMLGKMVISSIKALFKVTKRVSALFIHSFIYLLFIFNFLICLFLLFI